MTQKLIVIFSFGILIIFGASCRPSPAKQALAKQTPVMSESEKESYAIYSLVLRKELVNYGAPFYIATKPNMAFRLRINMSQTRLRYRNLLSPVTDDTIANFFQANESENTLEPKLDNGLEYLLVDPKEWGQRGNQNANPIKNCYLSLSRVGFNTENDQALVSVWLACEGSTTGTSFLLTKKGQSWKIKKQMVDFQACG